MNNSSIPLHEAEVAVVTLLDFLGYDTSSASLKQTPARVIKSFQEMTRGEQELPELYLRSLFDEANDQMVLVKNLYFTSLCEHHLLPFSGVAAIGYLPSKGRVVGLSKIDRVLQAYARRLQIQEKLTAQIATCMQKALEPQGVGVLIRATHGCMSCRGVRQPSAETVTSCLLGKIRDEPETRQEFFRLAE